MPGDFPWPDAPGWEVRYSRQFRAQLETRPFLQRNSEIAARLQTMFADPYTAARAKRLTGRHTGRRSARLDRRWRIIYRLCVECRQLGDQARAPLDCCAHGGTSDRTINILCLGDYHSRPDNVPEEFDFDDD